MSCPQYGEMGHGGALRGTPVYHGLQYLGCEHPYFETEWCGGLVVQWQTITPESHVGQQYASVDFSSKVGVFAHSFPKVHTLVGSVVHLAGCLNNERDPVHTSRH